MAGQNAKREWTPLALLISFAAIGGLGIASIWGLDWRWPASAAVAGLIFVIACGVRDGGQDREAETDDDLADWFDELAAEKRDGA